MKNIKSLLLLFCAILFFSCSSEDNEPTIQEFEEPSIAEIVNADGTKYTAHEGYISYRSKDGTTLKRIDFEYPDHIEIDLGYGDKGTIDYFCGGFRDFENKIILIFYPLCYQYEILNQTSAFVFMSDKDLNHISKKEIQSFNYIYFENELMLSLRIGGTYALYDKDINEILQGKTDKSMSWVGDFWGLARIGQYYYLAVNAGFESMFSPHAIINLNTGSVSELERISDEDIIKDHFAAETNPPRRGSSSYELIPGENGYLNVTLNFTLYNGSKKEVNYKYDVNGKVIR